MKSVDFFLVGGRKFAAESHLSNSGTNFFFLVPIYSQLWPPSHQSNCTELAYDIQGLLRCVRRGGGWCSVKYQGMLNAESNA